jgi:uncharacterized protein (DUF697 family)
MELDLRETARKRIQEAISLTRSREENADAAIWAAVILNASLGAVPFAINMWTFVGVTTVLVISLGRIYGYQVSNEGAGKIIRQVFTSASATTISLSIGMKFLVEVLKGAGVITMGGTTAAGMALDAVLCGAVTYAIGYTTKEYFVRDLVMSKNEIKREFNRAFAEGKTKMREQREKATCVRSPGTTRC